MYLSNLIPDRKEHMSTHRTPYFYFHVLLLPYFCDRLGCSLSAAILCCRTVVLAVRTCGGSGDGGGEHSGFSRPLLAFSRSHSARAEVSLSKRTNDKVARWQNLIPSFPWIAPGWRAWGRNPRKGRDQICSVA